MRKTLMAALLAIVMCLAALSGCAMVRGFEKDVQVVLMVNGEYRGSYTVNAFNNAIVPVPEAPQGLMFYGWTADENWEEKGAANVKVSANKGLIRYDDVKDYAGEKLSVTLYPVFGEIPRHDIAIAWYDKAATSGLNSAVIDGFTSKFYAFLTEKGYETKEMDIVIRSYAGNVGPTCEAIRGDGDIDIMIGWSNADNLTGTGGMKAGIDFLENNGNIFINPDFEKGARYAARLSDTEMCHLVYDWILNNYAGEGGPKLDYLYDGSTEPEPEPEPPVTDGPAITETQLNVSIWNNNFTWISEAQIEKLKTDFTAELTGKGVDVSKVTINWTVETATKVADLVASVNAAGNIDMVIGCGNNVNSEGNLTNLEKYKIPASEYMAADRFVAVLHADIPNQLAVLLYEFMTGTGFKLKVTETQLNVSIWNNNFTWISEAQIEKLKTDFTAELAGKGVDVSKITINWTVETATKVADLVASVNAAGNIDMVIGCGNNVNSEGNLTNLVKFKIPASEYMAADRFVAVLHKDAPNQLAVILYEFMTASGFTANAA